MANENECFGFRWKHSWCISCCSAMETGVNFVLISDVCIVSVLKKEMTLQHKLFVPSWKINNDSTSDVTHTNRMFVLIHNQFVYLLNWYFTPSQPRRSHQDDQDKHKSTNWLCLSQFTIIFLLVCLFCFLFVCFGRTDLTFVVDWALKNQLSLYLVCFVRSFLFCIYRSLACIRWWILNQYFHWFTHLISKSIIFFSC